MTRAKLEEGMKRKTLITEFDGLEKAIKERFADKIITMESGRDCAGKMFYKITCADYPEVKA